MPLHQRVDDLSVVPYDVFAEDLIRCGRCGRIRKATEDIEEVLHTRWLLRHFTQSQHAASSHRIARRFWAGGHTKLLGEELLERGPVFTETQQGFNAFVRL